MDIESGRRLGPYEILSLLGSGGMGEVWRARDTRLDRDVAVKVLASGLASDEQFRLRFEREARTISQLNHPHVCTIHDVGSDSGVSYLVMELLEGETLADRLAKGRLPMSDVIRYGAQIAEALGRAHRAGIIHRDLKPANIMLTKAGAKLLDFGLARGAVLQVRDDGATEHRPLTQEGTILGTFQYMAPEQLEGLEADERTDIFGLGNVLYEMATGKRPFDARTKTSLIAAIVERDPAPIREAQPLTPPVFEHVVAKCLAKQPEDRWQSALDVAEELRWIGEAGSQAGLPAPLVARRQSRERLFAGAAIALLFAAAALAVMYAGSSRRARQVLVTDVSPPQRMRFNAVGDIAGPIVISPDGRHVVYSVIENGIDSLWLRSFETGEAKKMVGTDGANFPFWSPDSRHVAFYLGTKLMRSDLTGSSPEPICTTSAGRGGTWGSGDWIVFSPLTLQPLMKVRATGGTPEAVTKLEPPHTSHRWPSFLPDGKHFLYLATNHQEPKSSANAIYLASTEGGAPRLVLRSVGNGIYSDGHLLFQRERTLYAQKMSDDGELSGEPVKVAEDVLYDAGIWRSAFSVSEEGTLVYHTGQATLASRLKWVDRAGRDLGEIGERSNYWDVEMSPNGQRIAVAIGDPQREMWVIDLQRNARTKVPIEAPYVDNAIWSGDGSTLYVDVMRGGSFAIIAKRLTGGERVLHKGKDFQAPRAIAPDGHEMLFDDADGKTARLPLVPAGPPTPLRSSTGAEAGWLAAYSPNGRWIALQNAENGRPEVFVISSNDPDLRWQVSTAGGVLPRWRRDGQELFYVDPNGRINAVPIREVERDLEIGSPEPLFTVPLRPQCRAYDVTPDGQRFIVNVVADDESPIARVVTNWTERLRR